MYLLMGIGISNIALINQLKKLDKDFILACNDWEIDKAIKYHDNVITYKMIKYLDLNKIEYVIKSPGIPYHNKYVRFLKNKRLKVINEIELTYILSKRKGFYIGVSGSVGKSSIVSILYDQISSHRDNVILAGNIGDPLINYLDKINKDTIIILELSSFQLDDFINMKLNIALLSNIYDNHLDVYKKKETYYLSKFKLANNQNKNDYFILNLDNQISKEYINDICIKSKVIDYMLGFEIKNNYLYFYKHCLLNLNLYPLLGKHNLDNLKAIVVVLSILNMKLNSKVLASFKGLKYHLEETIINNRLIVNDSKSTCTSSLKGALDTYKDRNIILLFGGLNKNLNFKFLNRYSLKYIICFGDLTSCIDKMINVDIKFNTLKEAVNFALDVSNEGDVILLSPGCASYDEFNSYLQRGQLFNEYIKEYYNG